MNTLEIIGIVYAVGVAWLAYEMYTSPIMPDNYDLREEDIWPEDQRPNKDKSIRKESHGKLGGNLEDVHMRGNNGICDCANPQVDKDKMCICGLPISEEVSKK